MKLAALVFLIGLATPVVVAATDLGLVTGAAEGTSYQFGLDLKRLVKPAGIELAVHSSRGSVDNLAALSERRNVQLAIVQADVLEFIAGGEASPVLAPIARRLRVVFPLYDEVVYVVARGGIADFEGLAGKRVAIGAEGSGTYVTARRLFKLADVKPRELVTIDAAQALSPLKTGQIDAMVYVAPSPLRLLAEQIRPEDGLTLLPVTSKSVLEWYNAVELPARGYAWQTAPVATVTVKAVLVALEAEGARCEAIGRFAQAVAAGLPWLRKHGHPRWQRVDLGQPIEGWAQSECVRPVQDGTGSVQASPPHPR